MSVNVKQNGNLTTVANNISITQANWNDRGNTDKNSCIKNQPATLNTLEEISANTDANALAGANAVKELSDRLDDINLAGLIKTKTVTSTTSSQGSISLEINHTDHILLNVSCSSAYEITTFYNSSGYYGRVIESTLNESKRKANTSVTVEVVYMDRV